MPALESPFVTKSLKCAVCHQPSDQRFFRQRLYVPEGLESDQHVTSYKWLAPAVQPVHPPYYVLYFCPHCRYADTTEDFSDPTATVYGAQVVKEFKRGRAPGALLQLLAQHVNYEEMDFPSALHLHFLAIVIQSLPPQEDLQDAYKLGRLYLRTAWLFREREAQNGDGAGGVKASPAAQAEAPSKTPEELLAVVEALETSWREQEASLSTLRQLVQRRVREITRAYPQAHHSYVACLSALNNAWAAQTQEIGRLKYAVQNDLAGAFEAPVVAPAAGETGAAAEGVPRRSLFQSHDALLERIKVLWPQAPVCERDALETAVAYFQRALTADKRFDNVQNSLKLTLLLADLMVRCGDTKGALEMARGLYTSAMGARQAATAQLQQKPGEGEEQRRLQADLKRATEALEAAGDLRQRVLDMMLERSMPTVREVMKTMAANGGDIDKALLARGVAPDVIAHLKKTGRLSTGKA